MVDLANFSAALDADETGPEFGVNGEDFSPPAGAQELSEGPDDEAAAAGLGGGFVLSVLAGAHVLNDETVVPAVVLGGDSLELSFWGANESNGGTLGDAAVPNCAFVGSSLLLSVWGGAHALKEELADEVDVCCFSSFCFSSLSVWLGVQELNGEPEDGTGGLLNGFCGDNLSPFPSFNAVNGGEAFFEESFVSAAPGVQEFQIVDEAVPALFAF